MLGKCAEALALRKAFPQELSGIYVREEMEQANSTHDDAQQRAIDVQKRIEAQTEEQQRERTRVETIRKHLALEGIDEKHWNEIISRLPVGSNLADLRRVAAEITAKE
jgi:benzoyl-CoA reductase/2-hydroxyglutaryl-CoA dehydratase subunit BcrC/BadD/HgdB